MSSTPTRNTASAREVPAAPARTRAHARAPIRARRNLLGEFVAVDATNPHHVTPVQNAASARAQTAGMNPRALKF
jgi:diaminopimelate epimerase